MSPSTHRMSVQPPDPGTLKARGVVERADPTAGREREAVLLRLKPATRVTQPLERARPHRLFKLAGF